MEFKKKLKIRLYLAIGYTLLGLAMIIVFNLFKNSNTLLSTFGLCFFVIGISRMIRYRRITKSEETIRKQEILESDERNIAISNKARGIAFISYIFIACIAIIILEFANQIQLVKVLSMTVCILVFVYWISYWILSKKY